MTAGGETIKDMQNMTGCKINVSQSSSPHDAEREIGLIGSRDAIEQAKRAIEDKVDVVVRRASPAPSSSSCIYLRLIVIVSASETCQPQPNE